MKKILVFIGIACVLSACDFNRIKNLRGTNYMLMDDDMGNVDLCYKLPGGGLGNTSDKSGHVRKVYWNKKYILAYKEAYRSDSIAQFYIIEQLKTDTIDQWGVLWTTYNRIQWIQYEYTTFEDFQHKIQELEIDTTKMNYYTWRSVIGIY